MTDPDLWDLLHDAADRHGERMALTRSRSVGGAGLTYRGLAGAAARGAGRLAASGLAPGDRVVLMVESRPEWAAGLFALLGAGLVVVPVPHDVDATAAAAVAGHATPSAVLFSERTASLTAAFGDRRGFEIEALLAPADEEVAPMHRRHPLALLAYTSGSTSAPRAVELTHENLLADLDALLAVRRAEPGNGFLSMLPPSHLYELTVGLLAPLACGARVVYPGSPLPNRLIDALREDGIRYALAVPALLDLLYQEVLEELVRADVVPRERLEQSLEEVARVVGAELDEDQIRRTIVGLRSRIGDTLDALMVGGAALDPAWAELAPALGLQIEVGYGLTEAAPVVAMGFASAVPSGSVGRPLPGIDVRISDEGEVLVRGKNVSPGYHRNPEATAAGFRDGWLRTGDRGRIDGDGFLFVLGRLKEAMVTAAGETIYPEEVEPYYAHPSFVEWCVAGMVGPNGNDVPTLFVVSAAASTGELDATFADLRARAPSRLRVGRMVVLHERLPRTATGKVRRRALAEEWRKRHE